MKSKPVPQPGLLEEANGCLLYIDEVNLLDDQIVNIIHDVTSTGVLVVQREGQSDQKPVSFTLVGTMNPEEGRLRPQLLDTLEIERLKLRVHCLSQEIWDCTEYPNRINILIMLSAAVAELLLLESNQEARREAI